MDEFEDFEKKAKREYEGISSSRDQRTGKIDNANLASLAFLNHLADDTQILRAMYHWCHCIEYNINTEYINENVHIEFFEGDMTTTEIVDNVPMLFLDRRKLFETIIMGIEIWLDGRDSDEEHEKEECGG
jgi:hypothetical protein